MRKRATKKEITLMTLLANEATNESRELLKRYKQPDAVNCADLELKLANLYTTTSDKFALEKEMAQIHPHKNWLLKRLGEDKKEQPIEAKEMENVSVSDIKPQQTTICCGNPYCPVHGCGMMPTYSNFNQSAKINPYSPDYNPNQTDTPLFKPESQYDKSQQGHLALIGIVAIFAMSIFVLTKYNK